MAAHPGRMAPAGCGAATNGRVGVTVGEAVTGLGAATLTALGRAVGTGPRRWLLALTLFLGLAAAVALAAEGSPTDRTFTNLSGPTQSLMSITLPSIGVLLVGDLRRARATRLMPTLLAAVLIAVAVGLFGVATCAVALGLAPTTAGVDPWARFATIAVGSVLVQVVAQLVGTGLGLLIRPAFVAFVASIALPLGLWFVLGTTDVLRPAQAWLTPFATVQNLFSGERDALGWVQWFVVFLLWGVGLNAVGAARLRRVHSGATAS
jgi:hypothetical protein